MGEIGKVEVILIPECADNDLIVAFFRDVSDTTGSLTLTCYGQAWTAYWGGHGHDNVKDFVNHVGMDYLMDKLQINPHMVLKQYRKIQERTLSRAVIALKKHIKENKK